MCFTKYIFTEIFFIYFDQIFSFPQFFPDSPLLSTHPTFHSFFQKEKKKQHQSNPQKHKHEKQTKTNKTKIKKPKQNETTNSQIYHGVYFVLANYSWAWGLPWSVVDIPSEIPLEKTDLLFASEYQLQIAYCLLPLLSVGVCLDPVWILYVPPQCQRSYLHQSLLHLDLVSLGHRYSHPLPLAVRIFLSPLPHIPECVGDGSRGLKTFHLGLTAPKCLTLRMLSNCGSLY